MENEKKNEDVILEKPGKPPNRISSSFEMND